MELKITKGEWAINNKLAIQVNPNDPINTSTIAQVMGNDEEAKANAKLIAASPDMLEALEWSLTQFKRLADMGRYPEFMLQKNGGQGVMPIVKAIEKATK